MQDQELLKAISRIKNDLNFIKNKIKRDNFMKQKEEIEQLKKELEEQKEMNCRYYLYLEIPLKKKVAEEEGYSHVSERFFLGESEKEIDDWIKRDFYLYKYFNETKGVIKNIISGDIFSNES